MSEEVLALPIAELVRRDPAIVMALADAGITPRYAYWRLGDALRDLHLDPGRLAALEVALSALAAAA